MRKNNKWIIFLGCLIITISVFQIVISDLTLFGNDLKSDNNEIIYEDSHGQKLKNSAEIGQGSFVDVGLSQNVSLYSSRNYTFINQTTEDSGIIISNSFPGWNMTYFQLNFTELRTSEKYIHFNTRNDGSDDFNEENIYYANSFTIPNSCFLKNISMFLQYWGGDAEGPWDYSEFTIRIYNATEDENGKLVPNETLDDYSQEILFDLTNEPLMQPARWYQSNYTNLMLNHTKTVNNTFFIVFQSIEFPFPGSFNPIAYMYYGYEQPDDLFKILFYKKIGLGGQWIKQNGTNGLFKINLAPLSDLPTADQVNLTVFNTPVNSSGFYYNSSFYPHKQNQFNIPISSPWFNEVKYNVSFLGNFRYNENSYSTFNATDGKDILWNLTLFMNHFPSDSRNNTARFYKPEFWRYNCTYNESVLFSDTEVNVNPTYIDLNNISNNNWTITFNQTNAILNTSIQLSNDNKTWINFVNFANMTDYINVSVQFNNSNGESSMYVYTSVLDIIFQENITENNFSFPIWRPHQDTSAKENNTLIRLQIHSNNGTMAGIKSLTFNVTLSKLNMTITGGDRTFNYGEYAVYNIFLNDTFTSENVSNSEFSIWANFSGISQPLDLISYDILDHNNGSYDITLITELMFDEKQVENLTLEFYAEKIGIYSQVNQNRTFKITTEPIPTNLTILSSSSNIVVYGDTPWISLQFRTEANGRNLTNAEFEIYNNSNLLPSYSYLVSELPDRYQITFLLDYLEIGDYNLTIIADKTGKEDISYINSSVNYNLTFILADFIVDLDSIPVIYTNDLSKSVILNISYNYGPIETAVINAYLGSNKLSFASTEPGIFKLFLDSTNLNINETYNLKITITKPKFRTYFEERSVYIHLYPSTIEIPEDFRNLTLYQEQDLELIVILKDIFRQQDILDAHVKMKIEGFISYSDEFIPVVSNFGWYQGTLNLGNLNP